MKISLPITDKATVTPSRPNHKEGQMPKNWWFRTVVLENTLESPFDYKKIKPVNTKEINPEYSLEGMMLKLRYSGHLMRRANLWEKTNAGKGWKQKEKGGGRGWNSWMASPTPRTWIWAKSGRQQRTETPGVLQSRGSQRAGHDLVTEQQQQLTWLTN